jgi:hypothetical protein
MATSTLGKLCFAPEPFALRLLMYIILVCSNYYVDPVYAGMHPFYCVVNQLVGVSNQNPPPFGVGSLCFVTQSNITGVPIFTHYGAGKIGGDAAENSPMPCECDKFGHEPECDVFNLITGFMFFDGMSMTDVVNIWLNLTVSNGGAFRLNQNAYNASWAAAASTYAPNVDPIYNDSAWRASSYEFCRTDDFGSCSLVAVNSYGTDVFDYSLTEYLFLLNDGSCAEQFVISDAAFDNMINSPPTPIVETYYDCVMTPYDSMMNAAGVASGNVSLIVPILVFMVLPLMYLWLTLTGNVQSKPEYENQELDSALQLLALQILRIRDDHLRGIKKDGLLIEMTRELVTAARLADGTAVDSDDSDDDDAYAPTTRPVKRAPSPVQDQAEADVTANPMQRPVGPRTIRRMSSTADVNARKGRRNSAQMETGGDVNEPAPRQQPQKRKSINDIRFLTSKFSTDMIRGADSDDEEDGLAHPGTTEVSPARPARRMSTKARRKSSAASVGALADIESGAGVGNPSIHEDL